MRVTNRDVWEGWALCAAEEKQKQMPPYVAQAVHPDCDNPTFAWAMLVGLQREREALFTGERLPKEVVGVSTADLNTAAQYLEHQMVFWTNELAFGSYREEWSETVTSKNVDG